MFLGLDFRTLRQRKVIYWLWSAAAIIGGLLITPRLDENHFWLKARYSLYQRLQELSPNQPEPQRTVMILIGDDEYWKGPLARRIPINRCYLAALIKALDACDPSVIALDFDLRSPLTNGTLVDNPEYETETAELTKTLREVSAHRAIVLPATFGIGSDGYFFTESAVYGNLPWQKGQIQRGYIQLIDDVRKMPLALTMSDGSRLDSFAESIVRAVRESHRLQELDKSNALSFGTFMEPKRFPVVPASDLTGAQDKACILIRHNVAIVGAAWHRFAFNEGPLVDLHETPTGSSSGAFIHANYVEALLASRILTPLRKLYALSIDIFSSILLALLLGVVTHGWYPTLKKSALIILMCLAIFLASYFAWQNLGLFFEAFFPITLLLAHALLDYVRELRRDAILYRISKKRPKEGPR